MENTLINNLSSRIKELQSLGVTGERIQRNVLKEELHYYVLNFIYNHPEYSKWTMYGGSVLRICHGLNRMSVDLDFEVEKMPDLKKLGNELIEYFKKNYEIDLEAKITREKGIILKLSIAKELGIGQSSSKIHVKIDLEKSCVKNVAFAKIPVNKGQFSFVVKTYNMGGLMASKIAAVFGRSERGFGDVVVDYKPQDIYDLIWYMGQEPKVLPDLDYLRDKGLDYPDVYEMFNDLTAKKIGRLDDSILKKELPNFFENQNYIVDWLKNWRIGYFKLKDDYKMRKVKKLINIRVWNAFETGNLVFDYTYEADDSGLFRVRYRISDYWFTFREGDINISIDKNIINLVEEKPDFRGATVDRLNKYITLFAEKTEKHFHKANRVVFGKSIITRVIRMTGDNLSQDQIVLDKSALKSCELGDLMK